MEPVLLALVLFFLFTLSRLWLLIRTIPQQIKVSDLQVNETTHKRDCRNENIKCVGNSDCIDICSGNFACNLGTNICEPFVWQTAASKQDGKCLSSHGSYLALAIDELFGNSWYCVRPLANLFDKSETLNTHVCNKGTFNVNADEKMPTVSDCKCPDQTNLMVKIGDPNTPRCVDQQLSQLLPSFTSTV